MQREADALEARTAELGDEINAVREDFRRKRNDQDVVGLPPEPEKERERTPGPGEQHSASADAPPVEGSPTKSESGAAAIVEDTVKLPGNPGDEGVHGEDPDAE